MEELCLVYECRVMSCWAGGGKIVLDANDSQYKVRETTLYIQNKEGVIKASLVSIL